MRLRELLLLLLFISFSHSDFFSLEIVKDVVLPTTILLVSLMLGLAWMASDMFSNPQLKAWVKTELRSLLAAGILLVLVYGLFFGTNSAASILTGEPNVNAAASAKLDSFIADLKPAYNDMVYASHYIGVISGFGYTAPTNLWFASFNFVNSPHSGIRALQSMVMQGASSVTQVFFIYLAIKILLEFFTTIVPTIILPLALSLRFIPFTKKLGNTLIAMCIGAAILFPVSVLIVGHFHELALTGISTPELDFGPFNEFRFPNIAWFCGGAETEDEPIVKIAKFFTSLSEIGWGVIVGLVCSVFPPCFICYFQPCYQLVVNVIFPVINLVYSALFWIIALADFNSFFGTLDVPAMYNALADFLQIVTYYVLMAYLDLILIGILTIVTTKSVSSAIGGESYMVGIQKLIG